jgi:hypothetical protein
MLLLPEYLSPSGSEPADLNRGQKLQLLRRLHQQLIFLHCKLTCKVSAEQLPEEKESSVAGGVHVSAPVPRVPKVEVATNAGVNGMARVENVSTDEVRLERGNEGTRTFIPLWFMSSDLFRVCC